MWRERWSVQIKEYKKSPPPPSRASISDEATQQKQSNPFHWTQDINILTSLLSPASIGWTWGDLRRGDIGDPLGVQSGTGAGREIAQRVRYLICRWMTWVWSLAFQYSLRIPGFGPKIKTNPTTITKKKCQSGRRSKVKGESWWQFSEEWGTLNVFIYAKISPQILLSGKIYRKDTVLGVRGSKSVQSVLFNKIFYMSDYFGLYTVTNGWLKIWECQILFN